MEGEDKEEECFVEERSVDFSLVMEDVNGFERGWRVLGDGDDEGLLDLVLPHIPIFM